MSRDILHCQNLGKETVCYWYLLGRGENTAKHRTFIGDSPSVVCLALNVSRRNLEKPSCGGACSSYLYGIDKE